MNKHIHEFHALARPFRALLARHHGAVHPAPATGNSSPPDGHSRHGHGDSAESTTSPVRWLLPVLLIAQLMVILDITAVNIALPSLSRDLGISGASISWTITSYSLIFGSLLLFGGRAADLLGRRRMFLTGLGVFTAPPAGAHATAQLSRRAAIEPWAFIVFRSRTPRRARPRSGCPADQVPSR